MNQFAKFAVIGAVGVGAFLLLRSPARREDNVDAGFTTGRLMSSGTGEPLAGPTNIYAFESPSFSEPVDSMSFENQGIAPPSKKEASSISQDSVYSGGYSVADPSKGNFSTSSGPAYVPPPSSSLMSVDSKKDLSRSDPNVATYTPPKTDGGFKFVSVASKKDKEKTSE